MPVGQAHSVAPGAAGSEPPTGTSGRLTGRMRIGAQPSFAAAPVSRIRLLRYRGKEAVRAAARVGFCRSGDQVTDWRLDHLGGITDLRCPCDHRYRGTEGLVEKSCSNAKGLNGVGLITVRRDWTTRARPVSVLGTIDDAQRPFWR